MAPFKLRVFAEERTALRHLRSALGYLSPEQFEEKRRKASCHGPNRVHPDAVRPVSFARNYWSAVDDAARSIPVLPTPEKSPAGGGDPRMLKPQLEDPLSGNFGVPDDSPVRKHGAGAWPGRPKQ